MSNQTKLVVVSDIHLHPWKAFSDGSGRNNTRLQQTLNVLRETLQKARELDKLWLCAGDIIHSTGFAYHEVSSALIDLLNEFPDVQKIGVSGNHDGRGQGGEVSLDETFWFTLENSVDNLYVLDQECFYTDDGLVIWGFGAQNQIDIVEKQVSEKIDNPPVDIILYHQMVAGASFPSGMGTDHGMDPMFLRKYARLSILGDIHKPHLDTEDGHSILIPGSLEPHNFGDKGPRGYWIITMEQDGEKWFPVNFEDIESDSPKFITVEDPSEVKNDGNYYRVLGGEGDIPENAVAVKSSPDVVESRDLLEGAHNQREILKRWVELNPPEGMFSDKYLKKGLDVLRRQDDIVPRDARIRRVEGENFFSYEDFSYDVRDGVHLIIGRSHYYDSNGSGKSSLLESLYWCLFGKTTKGVSASDVIRWGADSCYVQVEIELDGKELVVRRSRTKHSISLEVWIDGEEVTAETNTALSEKLEGILGWTPNLFKALGYFSQEDLVLLSRSTDSELKTILADLRGLSAYQKAAEEAGSLSREAASDVNTYTSKVNTLTDELSRDEGRLETEISTKKAWEKNHEKKLTQLTQEIDRLTEEQETIEDRLDKQLGRIRSRGDRLLEQAQGMRDRLRKEKVQYYKDNILEGTEDLLETWQGKVDICREILKDHPNDITVDTLSARIDELKDKIRGGKNNVNNVVMRQENLQETIAEIKKSVKHIKQELDKLKKGSESDSPVCPTCGQVIESGESREAVIHTRKEKQNEYSKKLEKAQQEIQECKKAEETFREELEAWRTELKDLKDARAVLIKKNELQKNIQQLKNKVANAEETAKAKAERDADAWFSRRKQRIQARISRAEKIVERKKQPVRESLRKAKNDLSQEKAKTNPHAESVRNIRESIQERRSERWRAHRRSREAEVQENIYDYWKDAFGKSGIQSLLIEDVATLFNKHRTQVFPTLTRGKYDVQMSAVSETQSGEQREKAEYRVFQEGKEVPYEALSGGQRRRVDLGVLLTTTLAASKAHGVPGALGTLILDEVASYLDGDGAEALAETLEEYCPDIVPSVFVVSQDTTHKALYNNVIVVEQDENGISKVMRH